MLRLLIWGQFHTHRSRVPVCANLRGTHGHVAAVAAGSKHIAIVSGEGHIALIGSNRHGQIGQPVDTALTHNEMKPYLYEFDYMPDEPRLNAVSCGCNFNIFYKRHSNFGVVIGSNTYGQLGLGHKDLVDASQGAPSWIPEECEFLQKGRKVADVVCGFNHTFFRMSDGSLWSCGSNTFGELGMEDGHDFDLISPMAPQRVTYFERKGIEVVDVKAGNSWSLFLAKDGRVFGCGTFVSGQLTTWARGPVVQALHRQFAASAEVGKVRPLIRIEHIGCLADMALYVGKSKGGEIFARGSLPDVGFIEAQHTVVKLSETPVEPLRGIVCGATHALLVGAEGGPILGVGDAMEGQLGPGSTAGVARDPVQLCPRWLPPSEGHWRDKVAAGHGFSLLAPPFPEELRGIREVQWPEV